MGSILFNFLYIIGCIRVLVYPVLIWGGIRYRIYKGKVTSVEHPKPVGAPNVDSKYRLVDMLPEATSVVKSPRGGLCATRKRRILLCNIVLLLLAGTAYVFSSLIKLQQARSMGYLGDDKTGFVVAEEPVHALSRIFTVNVASSVIDSNTMISNTITNTSVSDDLIILSNTTDYTNTITIASGWVMDLHVPAQNRTTLTWEWSVDQKDIGFTATLLSGSETGTANGTAATRVRDGKLVVPNRVYHAGETIRGEFTYPCDGVVSLRWNNQYSWVRAKTIMYTLRMSHPEQAAPLEITAFSKSLEPEQAGASVAEVQS
jgi:hypothetical protein